MKKIEMAERRMQNTKAKDQKNINPESYPVTCFNPSFLDGKPASIICQVAGFFLGLKKLPKNDISPELPTLPVQGIQALCPFTRGQKEQKVSRQTFSCSRAF